MRKLATLSNSILYSIAGALIVLAYFIAIKPTVELYQQVNILEKQQEQNSTDKLPNGNIKELTKLDSLLAPLTSQRDVHSVVLSAVGDSKLKLQSFKEEKVEEKEYGGKKGIKKYVLTVSGDYKNLLSLCGALQSLAISSSRFYLNDNQEEFLSLDILTNAK